jgi:predicted nuclease of restriction endonuclease-like RecB superfamily
MLTSDLLLTRSEGPYLYPRYIKVDAARFHQMAEELIALYAEYQGKTRRELTEGLNRYAEDSTDYRIQRGLAKLLGDDRCEFTERTVAPPAEIRQRLFALARENHPVVLHPDLIHPVTKDELLLEMAREYKTEPEQIAWALYADLTDNHILTRFDPPTPEWLLQRYNVALAQALLYRCIRMKLSVFRNIPSRYKQLFKFIKFYQLMHAIQGDLDSGYEVLLDGPVSLFRLSQKYGLQLAVFLPALLLCTRWKMEAEIVMPDGSPRFFPLDESAGLVSHYRDSTMYDSLLERTFAERFVEIESEWQIEREVAIINLKETVFIPDFAFRHADGRTALLEIVGFWRPDYLEKKLMKLKRSGRMDMVVAVSADLNVGEEDFKDMPGSVFFFKQRINPKEVVARLEQVGRDAKNES